MRTLILTSLLLLCSSASGEDWRQRYTPPGRQTITETRYGDTAYGTYIGGGYISRTYGPTTITNVYVVPTFGSGIQPPTRIYSGPQPRSYYYPSR